MKKIYICTSFFCLFYVMGELKAYTKDRKPRKTNVQAVKKEVSGQAYTQKNKKTEVVPENLKLVNYIAAKVLTDSYPLIFTHTDLHRKSINGAEQTADEIIMFGIMYYEALEIYKIPAQDDSITKYVADLKKQHDLTDEAIKQMFGAAGYTYTEGLEQLKMHRSVDTLLNLKITSRLVVTREEIEAYFTQNPETVQAQYRIQKGFIDKDLCTEDEIYTKLKTHKLARHIDWSDSYWLDEDEIADNRLFIKDMAEDEIAFVESDGDRYVFIQMLKKSPAHERTLEERYKEIADILRAPLFEKMFSEYKAELLEKYEVIKFE